MSAYLWQSDNLTQALGALSPTWQNAAGFVSSQRIVTDTRQIVAGDVFLALKGEQFDGHDYLAEAQKKGAVLAIVSRHVDCDLAQLVVTDTRLALGLLGKFRRDTHPNLKIIAITGSSGKTTVKEMLGAIFGQLAPTLITRGNLNNDLGVPMMLLELQDEHRYAIIELGANHVGEIAYTTNLVRPDVACVLNIGTAHLGEFGGRDNIAKTKAEIFQGLGAHGVAVLPFGDDYFDDLQAFAQAFTGNVMSFGERHVALHEAGLAPEDIHAAGLTQQDRVLLMGDVFADDIDICATHSQFSLNVNLTADDVQSSNITLQFAGEHNVTNALAAAACALALDVPLTTITAGLNRAAPAKGRLNFYKVGRHTIIDDTYNANPAAVLAALAVLNNQDGQTLLVLGDIGELGDEAVSEHGKLGVDIARIGVNQLFAVGDLMAHTSHAAQQNGVQAQHFADKTALTEEIVALLTQSDESWAVLFKGSRFMAMETVMNTLMEHLSA